jgi:hypothetical protein
MKPPCTVVVDIGEVVNYDLLTLVLDMQSRPNTLDSVDKVTTI